MKKQLPNRSISGALRSLASHLDNTGDDLDSALECMEFRTLCELENVLVAVSDHITVFRDEFECKDNWDKEEDA